jgi:hypothetical protein
MITVGVIGLLPLLALPLLWGQERGAVPAPAPGADQAQRDVAPEVR